MISISDTTRAGDVAVPNDTKVIGSELIHAMKGPGGAEHHLDAFRLEGMD